MRMVFFENQKTTTSSWLMSWRYHDLGGGMGVALLPCLGRLPRRGGGDQVTGDRGRGDCVSPPLEGNTRTPPFACPAGAVGFTYKPPLR
jgi:hypothetical protein